MRGDGLSGFMESVPQRLGFRTAGLGGVPLEEALGMIAAAGYALVEFCMEHRDALSYSGSLSGLGLSSVSYHGKKDSPDVRERMIDSAIRKAVELGAGVLVLGSPLSCLCSREAFFEECFRTMDMLPKSIRPAWEPEPGTVLKDLEAFGELADHLGAKAGLNLDFGHAFLDELSPPEAVKSYGDRILHTHIEDMVCGVHKHLIPGRGDFPWKAMLPALDGIPYSGPLVVDLFELPDAPASYVRASYDGVLRELGAI
ncbi:MAG: sugar phosphate isomerase/epimerase [Candidatus Fermentibacteraceae bacterium]